MHFADRLVAAVRAKKTPLCVGLDPRWDSLPRALRERHTSAARAFEEFGCRVLDVVAPLVPVVKLQSAFFEGCGPAGMLAQQRVLAKARRLGLFTILDAKRNDIASTATAYADAAFGDVWDADALTINPYLGRDAVEPFLQSARQRQRGVFVLVKTSNPGGGQFQDLLCEDKPIYEHVANAVAAWGDENRGTCGYGDVGAVAGATHPEQMKRLRSLLPNAFFLVPGYGAQGASAADTAAAFHNDGLGAVVNSSRGIIFAYDPEERNWEAQVEAATRSAIADLPCVMP